MRSPAPLLVLLALSLAACSEELPADVPGYADRCVRMNVEPIPPTEGDDPHEGEKNVYACNVTVGDLLASDGSRILPYPDGTLIVKESSKPSQGFVWLVATARKAGGSWEWDEYTRNFASEDLLRIPSSEAVCVDCHRKVEAVDWIYTGYQAP